jgi:glyoxylase-like metal-dependent hydrolase (beta-lactamase superfamily II)
VDVVKLAPGLWRWTARHPDWTSEHGGPDGWGPDVASFFCEADGTILLVDPIVPADADERARFWRALDRDVERAGPPQVVLTCSWHARSSGDMLDRYPGARLWAPAAGLAELPGDLVVTDPFRPGDALPAGATALEAAVGEGEVLFWLPSHSALVAGDTLLGGGPYGVQLCPVSWLGQADVDEVRGSLRARIHGLPVERVLPTHGEPVLGRGADALERALARPS